MGTYVAFLRGMNLGRRRVRNDELRACFERLGFESVSAFLASGNVIFSTRSRNASSLEKKIQSGLREQLEYAVPTFLRSAAEVVAIAGQRPFSSRELSATEGNVQVALLGSEPSRENRKAALALSTPDDRLVVKGRELFWLPRRGVSDSELDTKALAEALGPMTVRNRRTLERLAARIG
jgi:uncharacterized protein (DUF1697 family)